MTSLCLSPFYLCGRSNGRVLAGGRKQRAKSPFRCPTPVQGEDKHLSIGLQSPSTSLLPAVVGLDLTLTSRLRASIDPVGSIVIADERDLILTRHICHRRPPLQSPAIDSTRVRPLLRGLDRIRDFIAAALMRLQTLPLRTVCAFRRSFFQNSCSHSPHFTTFLRRRCDCHFPAARWDLIMCYFHSSMVRISLIICQ